MGSGPASGLKALAPGLTGVEITPRVRLGRNARTAFRAEANGAGVTLPAQEANVE